MGGYLYIVLAMAIWSTQGVVVKLSGAKAHELLFYSLLFASVIQSTIFLNPLNRKEFPPLKKIPHIVLLCFFILINTFTFIYAYTKTSVANAVFTHYIAPVVVAVLAPVFLNERITFRTIISVCVATFGLWILLGDISIFSIVKDLFSGKDSAGLDSNTKGLIAGTISGIAYGLLIITAKSLTFSISNKYVLVFVQNLIMLIIFIPFASRLTLDYLWAVLIMSSCYATIAPYVYYKGLYIIEANKAAILGYMEPVFAIIFAMLFLNEYPTGLSIVGGALIILSGYMVIFNKEKAV